MRRKIRIAQYGIGHIASRITRNLLDREGVEIVAAFARNPAQIGRDLGEVTETGHIGLAISNSSDAARIMKDRGVDLCFSTIQGSLDGQKPVYVDSALAGANCISICGAGYWPWAYPSLVEIVNEMDALYKEHNVSLFCGGYQDLYWSSLITALSGGFYSIKSIRGIMTNIYDDGYAEWAIRGHGVGYTQDAFREKFGNDAGGFVTMPGDPNGWLANELGLRITSHNMYMRPVIAEEELNLPKTGIRVPVGDTVGSCLGDVTETEEGVTLEFAYCGKAPTRGDDECNNKWQIEGEPNMSMTLTETDGQELTASTQINRIPDVINAQPGYLMSRDMPVNSYKARPLNEYIND